MSNIPMSRPDMALAIHEQKYGHSSTFVELEGGRILHAADTAFTISEDGGITWSAPFHCQDENGEPVGAPNTSLVKFSRGGIGLAGRRRTDSGAQIIFWRSEDEGKTWAAPVVVNPSGYAAHALQDVMLRTSLGRLILPAYFEIGQGGWRMEGAPFVGALINGNFVSTDAHHYDPHFGACYIFYSDDDGRTWHKNKDGELFIITDFGGAFEPTFEPTVAELTPGKLLMFMRTRLGRLYQAWSEDNGESWSRPQPTTLAASHSPAQLRKIPDTGHLLVVWTQQSEREIKQGFVRTRLSSAISRSGGGVWEFFQNVESIHEETHVEPGPIRPTLPEGRYSETGKPAHERQADYVVPLPVGWGRWSYPSVFVWKDRVLISHTYSYYNERGERVNPGGSRLKVLPLEWFYGGQDRFRENEELKHIAEAARP